MRRDRYYDDAVGICLGVVVEDVDHFDVVPPWHVLAAEVEQVGQRGQRARHLPCHVQPELPVLIA